MSDFGCSAQKNLENVFDAAGIDSLIEYAERHKTEIDGYIEAAKKRKIEVAGVAFLYHIWVRKIKDTVYENNKRRERTFYEGTGDRIPSLNGERHYAQQIYPSGHPHRVPADQKQELINRMKVKAQEWNLVQVDGGVHGRPFEAMSPALIEGKKVEV